MGLKPRGVVVGLIGNVLIGVALFHLIQQGSCGNPGEAACSSEVLPYVLMLPAGIILSIAAAFLGGAALTFTGTFIAVGLGSMAASAFGDNPDTKSFGWIFGAAFVF